MLTIEEQLHLLRKNNIVSEVECATNDGTLFPYVRIDLIKLIEDLAEFKFMYDGVSK